MTSKALDVVKTLGFYGSFIVDAVGFSGVFWFLGTQMWLIYALLITPINRLFPGLDFLRRFSRRGQRGRKK